MIWWRDVMIIGLIVGLSIPVGRYIAAVMAGKKGVVERGFKTSWKNAFIVSSATKTHPLKCRVVNLYWQLCCCSSHEFIRCDRRADRPSNGYRLTPIISITCLGIWLSIRL